MPKDNRLKEKETERDRDRPSGQGCQGWSVRDADLNAASLQLAKGGRSEQRCGTTGVPRTEGLLVWLAQKKGRM